MRHFQQLQMTRLQLAGHESCRQNRNTKTVEYEPDNRRDRRHAIDLHVRLAGGYKQAGDKHMRR
jgi:hypothetical protein